MKKTAIIFITAINLVSIGFASEIETLRNSSELKSFDLQTMGQSVVENTNLLPQEISPAEVKISEIDNYTYQHLLFLKMQSNALKTISYTLKGLEMLHSPDMAPKKYTRGVEEASSNIEDSITMIEFSLKYRDSMSFYQEMVYITLHTEQLRKLSKSIENHPNYNYWSGKDIKTTADEMDKNISGIREANASFLYAFATPDLKDKRLKKEWKKFVDKRKSDLARWESLLKEEKLTFSELTELLKAVPDLVEMWELYQMEFMKRN